MSWATPLPPSRPATRQPRRRTAGLAEQTLTIDGVARTFLLSSTPGPPRPTVIALHGGGGRAAGMVGLTDLARRGTPAGFATVFPEGVHRGWNDGRPGARRADIDDAGFLVALIDHLVATGVSRLGQVFVSGMSNGAFMADHLARVAPDHVAGIGLVAGTASVGAPGSTGPGGRPLPVMLFHGDADPIIPYRGGPVTIARPGGGRRAGWRRRGRADPVGRPGPDRSDRGVCLGAEALRSRLGPTRRLRS